MKKIGCVVFALLLSFTVNAKDRLEVYEDYDIGEEVILMTTVKVDPNMGDVYLAGISQTWLKAMAVQKELGFIKDYKVYSSELGLSGDFNMLLVTTFENSADVEPNKEKYLAFMKKWGEANQENSNKISATYPEVRTITGEYRLREIIMK